MTSAEAAHRRSGAMARGWRTFRSWRRHRPFWGGLFTLLSGLEIFASTQLSLGDIQLHIGVEGFLSYIIPLVLILAGLLIWFTPQQRIFYGVIAVVVAVYSFIGVNFGGFFIGMLLGIIGGALAVAWTPVKAAAPAPAGTGDDRPDGGHAGGVADPPAEPDEEYDRRGAHATVDELLTGPLTDVLPRPVNPLRQPPHTERSRAERGQAERSERSRAERSPAEWEERAGETTQPLPGPWPATDQERAGTEPPHAAAPHPAPPPQASAPNAVPPQAPQASGPNAVPPRAAQASGPNAVPPRAAPPDEPGPDNSLPRRGPRLFVITLIPLTLAAVALANLQRIPAANAAPCPTPSASATGSAAAHLPRPGTSGRPGPGTSHSSTPSPTPAASSPSTDDSGNPIGDIIGGIGDAIGDLLGGDDPTPTPTPTPSTTPGAPPSGGGSTGTPGGRDPTRPSRSASAASPTPKASGACPSQSPPAKAKKLAAAADQPPVQKVPDRMTGTKLSLSGFSFDGVAELPTADGGTIRCLQFSMSRAVTDSFQLRVPGPDGHTISLKSSALTVQSSGEKVKFYASRFQGKLLGIPLTFTPDLPPPLTLPEMVFTDIDIQLVFVDSEELLAPDLITEFL